MSDKPLIDLWAGFLRHEKLETGKMEEYWVLRILELCEALAKKPDEFKPFQSYKDRLTTRRLLVNTAMDMGIDLPAIKYKGKTLMGRGLLDAWNQEYQKRHGSVIGTASDYEARRRNVKTRLAEQDRQERIKNRLDNPQL